MCIYECLTTPFLLFKQKNTGTFFIYRIHYPLLCVPKWQELKNKPHLGCFLFTWAPRLCQTRQGSFPGRWWSPRLVLLTEEAELSGCLDLLLGLWREDSGPFIEKRRRVNYQKHKLICCSTLKAWPLWKCNDLSICRCCVSTISCIYKSISIYLVYTIWHFKQWRWVVSVCSLRESGGVYKYRRESGKHYLLFCPLARKREDMLGLMTFCSAVGGFTTLENAPWIQL